MKHTLLHAQQATCSLSLLMCSLVVVLTAHVPHALAEAAPEASEPAAYRTTVREALSEYTAKHWPEARALFEEAHRLFPNARTLRGLGMTAFELRDYRDSVGYLKAALDSHVKPLDGNLRVETERLLTRAERYIGKVTIQVTPSDTQVTIDGAATAIKPDAPVLLDLGDHNFAFQATGYVPDTRTLSVKGRENETWTIVLKPVPAPVVAAPTPVVPTPAETARASEPERHGTRYVNLDATPERRRDKPLYKNGWLWTGVAVVVVAAVVVPVVIATRKDKVAAPEVGNNTPPNGGVFSALGARQ